MFSQKDVDVLVAINERGLFIIDQVNNVSEFEARIEKMNQKDC